MTLQLRNKVLLLMLLVLIIVIVSFTFSFSFLISNKLSDVSPQAKESVKAVLKAYYMSRITGDYWENEMILQSKSIANLELNARLDFYRAIILYCNLDTSPAYLFRKIVANDMVSLKKYLELYKKRKRYKDLDERQQKNLNDWIFTFDSVLKKD